MDDTQTDPHDDSVTSVPLPTNVGDGADKVIAQQNQSPEVAAGGGEWPSPDTPATGPAPGTAGVPHTRTAAEGNGPDRNPQSPASDDEDGAFPPMREVLDAHPVAGGSQSAADDDETDREGDAEQSVHGWGGSRLP